MARASTGMVGTRIPGMASLGGGLGIQTADIIPFWWSERETDPCAPSAAWCYWMPGASYFKECEPMDSVKCASAINRPPPTVTPAAPQSYGTLTITGAWSPEEMLAQTQRQQQIANTAYGQGNQATGPRAAGDIDVEGLDKTYTNIFLFGVIGLAAYLLLRGK